MLSVRALSINIRRFLQIRSGEAARIGSMAAFLFFLLAANNVIKIVRDSLFLSRFPITQLAYVYLLAALLASGVTGIYSYYASRLSLSQIILGSHVFIVLNVIVFWFLITFYDFAWVLYGFYMWSAIVGLVAVAQFWTLANELFNPREGKRLFGIITGAGTLGAMAGGFGANLAVTFLFGTNQLLWLILVLFAGAFAAAWFAIKEAKHVFLKNGEQPALDELQFRDHSGVVQSLRGSAYLQAIAALLFISVIVSTLIDYQFKAAAKTAYPSAEGLASFFGTYYAFLSVITLFVQVWLTGRILMGFGLTPTLLVLPLTLLGGTLGLLLWPGLFTATGTRLAEASLRTSLDDSGVEILYLPIPAFIKKKIKVFLDVTVERLGDGTAALIILFCTLFLRRPETSAIGYFSLGLIFVWIAVVFIVRQGYMGALRNSLAHREISFDETRIDFDKETIGAVLKMLQAESEQSVLFGLKLAAEFDPRVVAPRLPRNLLRHSSPEVRAQAIQLFSASPDQTTMNEISEMLQDENYEVQAEAIGAACAIFKTDAVSIVRSYIKSPAARVKRRALECLLRHGDERARAGALDSVREMVDSRNAEQTRVEAAHLMGDVGHLAFAPHLSKLIQEDPSRHVVREAMIAAGKRRYLEVLGDIIFRLGDKDTKTGAQDALIEYGEAAVKPLRDALFNPHVSREIRFNIPRTLSKIHSQSAMNALFGGLLEQDRSIRFQAILALEQMTRRCADLKVDREVVESAILSDGMLYSQRFAIFYVLFANWDESMVQRTSLLGQALRDSMERIRERVIWLLSLIYSARDIRGIWSALNSGDPTKQAHAVELLDNLLKGDVKRYSFLLYGDALQPARFKIALGFLGWPGLNPNGALRMLLEQEDVWLAAATMREIGLRGVTGLREEIVKSLKSENPVLRETAEQVIQRSDRGMEPAKLTAVDKVIFLKSVDIFAHLTIEQLGRVAGLTTEVRFQPAETIVREGEPIDAVYLLLSGRVVLEKGGQKAREIGKGNAFGTVAALDFNAAVHTIKVLDHVHALRLDARDLHDLLSQDIELVEGVIRVLCRMIRASQ
jgi:ATP/ADP translocase/HEAT repeat protein